MPPEVKYPLAAVTALAYSPDGKRVALGTFGQVVVYDTATWQPVAISREVEETARSLAFSSDNQTLAIGSGMSARSGKLVVWNSVGKEPPLPYPYQKDTVETVAFRKDGKGLLYGANDNRVLYYGQFPYRDRHLLDEHNGRVQAVAFSPKDDYIFVTGALDRIVKVWDMKTMHTVVNFDQSEGGVTGLAFLPNGDQFVGSCLDGKLRWWGVGYNKKQNAWGGYYFRVIDAHDGGVFALSESANQQRMITCGADKTVKVWNMDGGLIRAFSDSPQPIYAVALSPDGKQAIGGGRTGFLYVWDVEANKLLNILAPSPLPAAPAPKAKPTLSFVPNKIKTASNKGK